MILLFQKIKMAILLTQYACTRIRTLNTKTFPHRDTEKTEITEGDNHFLFSLSRVLSRLN